jgi:hypothetical protein
MTATSIDNSNISSSLASSRVSCHSLPAHQPAHQPAVTVWMPRIRHVHLCAGAFLLRGLDYSSLLLHKSPPYEWCLAPLVVLLGKTGMVGRAPAAIYSVCITDYFTRKKRLE